MNRRALQLAIIGGVCGDLLAACSFGSSNIATSSADAGAAAALISKYRATKGLGPVSVDARLNAAAADQARAIAQAGSLSHGNFSGRMSMLDVQAAAENLSWGPKTIAEVIQQWRESPEHNRNMLGRSYTLIGLARADAGRRYWALLLAR